MYSSFVHRIGGGLYWAVSMLFSRVSICSLQILVLLPVSKTIWVSISSCIRFVVVVMGTIFFWYAVLMSTQIFSPLGLRDLFFLEIYFLSSPTDIIWGVKWCKSGFNWPEKVNGFDSKTFHQQKQHSMVWTVKSVTEVFMREVSYQMPAKLIPYVPAEARSYSLLTAAGL